MQQQKTKPGKYRIIAGDLRGRRFPIPDISGVRPTPDRIRETVFNWLAPHIVDANCLDLFAGSGALGFEALSRGARHITMVEHDSDVIAHLNGIANDLGAKDVKVLQADASKMTQFREQPFDLVFVDPPYHNELIAPVCACLATPGLLSDGALIYLEAESELQDLPLPDGWEVLRSKKSGHVGYHLVQC